MQAPIDQNWQLALAALSRMPVDTPAQRAAREARFLALCPLEYAGVERRPYEESAAQDVPRATFKTLPFRVRDTPLGVGAEAVQLLVRRDHMDFAMRVSRAGKSDAEEIAKHMVLERLRVLYPELLRNVVQMVDFRLYRGLDLSVYPAPSNAEVDPGPDHPRMVAFTQRLHSTLGKARAALVHAPQQDDGTRYFDLVLGAITQMLCQLHVLNTLADEFVHNDLHFGNMMLRDPLPQDRVRSGELHYELRMSVEPTAQAAFKLRVPLALTGGRVMCLIDLGKSALVHRPRAEPADQVMGGPHGSERLYSNDAFYIVKWLHEDAKDAEELGSSVVARALAMLTELLAFIVEHHPPEHRGNRLALAEILRDAPQFARFRADAGLSEASSPFLRQDSQVTLVRQPIN